MSVFDEFPKPACAQTLGWELLSADEETGDVRVQLEGKTEFCNPSGNIQGRFLAAMLDDTLAPAVLVRSAGALYCATIDLRVSFLAPAKPGRLVGEGHIVKMGKTIAFLEGRLLDDHCEVAATATASARVVPTAGLERA
jgi:uncharacterized protein (TIGR00369 family)